ncbi:M50 family metallopeptidase [Sphingomonas kaistensis]|uniref:M50 family metallopeptidase n=1 Tax=Sphingomonas kaistensis TaxID=298708 RepID=A0ABZ2FYY8_9SPHN
MIRTDFKKDAKMRAATLALIAIVSVLLWQTRIGSFLLYPFTILATWFHEFGHGVAALLTGNSFNKLLIFPDGSGLAYTSRSADAFRLTDAFVPAGGLFGPPVAGALLIICSKSREATQGALSLLGILLLASTAIWVRTLVGWLVLPAIGLLILWIAYRGSPPLQRFVIQLLGVQAIISTWQQLDYLFTSQADVGGESGLSDTGAIEAALFAPYWFWGALISVMSAVLLLWSLKVAFRR